MRVFLRLGIAMVVALTVPIGSAGSAQAARPKWLTVAAGENHTCAVATDRALYCWGYGPKGALGDGTDRSRDTPTRVGTSRNWSSIAVGYNHTCGVQTTGALFCWGENEQNQLGDGTNIDQLVPRRIGTLANWATVVAGNEHTCAKNRAGSIYCWGNNFYGQGGVDGLTDTQRPVRVGTASDWATLYASTVHTCALKTTGALYCWGLNFSGEVGDGTSENDKFAPTRVGKLSGWTSVAVGKNHTCARYKTGSLYCWGNNEYGQLGDSFYNGYRIPHRVGTSKSWTTVVAGDKHTCARYKTGSLYCWGTGEYALGYRSNAAEAHRKPTQVGTSRNWATLSAGAETNCALDTSGYASCWGYGEFGNLGSGDRVSRPTPTPVVSVTPYKN